MQDWRGHIWAFHLYTEIKRGASRCAQKRGQGCGSSPISPQVSKDDHTATEAKEDQVVHPFPVCAFAVETLFRRVCRF